MGYGNLITHAKLILHGIEEESNENTNQRVIDVLSESMAEAISIQDID